LEFQRAIDIKPDVTDFYYSIGIAEEKLFLWDDAIRDYRKAIEMNRKIPFVRDDPYLFNNLANAEAGKQDYAAALEDFTYASKLDNSFEAPALGRALVLFQMGKDNESLQYFKNLQKKYPNYTDGNAVLAIMMQDTDKEQSKALWDDVLKQDPRYSDINWIRDIRRWPPRLVTLLEKFTQT
jgi:tetratricopeptide (TPR) repeat protein